MPARQETRDLIMVSMAGVGPAGDLDGLPRHGWQSWKAESASDILRLLKTQPQACFAALLDLRGADPRQAGPTRVDQLMPVLTDPRIGWVAGVPQKQLEQAWERPHGHQHLHSHLSPRPAQHMPGVQLWTLKGWCALGPQ